MHFGSMAVAIFSHVELLLSVEEIDETMAGTIAPQLSKLCSTTEYLYTETVPYKDAIAPVESPAENQLLPHDFPCF